MMEKLIPDPFWKNQNRAYLWINRIKLCTICFYLCPIYQIYWNCADHWLLLHIKLFQKTRWSLELVSLPHFLHDFWTKIFFTLYSISSPNYMIWLRLLLGMLGNMYIVIVYFVGCDVINFEINLTFVIKLFSHMTK